MYRVVDNSHSTCPNISLSQAMDHDDKSWKGVSVPFSCLEIVNGLSLAQRNVDKRSWTSEIMRHTKTFPTVLIHSDKGENVIPLDLKKLILLGMGGYSDSKVGWRCRNFTVDSEFSSTRKGNLPEPWSPLSIISPNHWWFTSSSLCTGNYCFSKTTSCSP